MQVELVGCTSAGKSTLATLLVEVAREENIDLVLGDEFALGACGRWLSRWTWPRAAMIHAVAIGGCLSSAVKYLRFVRLARRCLRQSEISLLQQWNQLRKVLKQLGRFEVISRRCPGQSIVLVDEGTVHAAHNLFVHVKGELDQEGVREFAELVPLPDAVIYLSAAEDLLVDRILQRGHRRIADPTRQVVKPFVHKAVATFDQLSRHERIKSRTLVVRNGMVTSDALENGDPRGEVLRRLLRKADLLNQDRTEGTSARTPRMVTMETIL